MSKKLIFVMSDSDAYLHDEAIRIQKEWGFTTNNVKRVEEWSHSLVGSSVSLFGDVSMIHLDLSDQHKLKAFVKLIDDKKEKKFFEGHWFGPGLIITSTYTRGTKKIENLVKASGGTVAKKAKPAEMRELLLGRINLSRETRAFSEAYVGDDYDMLISVVNQLEKLSKEEQGSITPEELIVKLPIRPGAVPPWDFINPMLEGNAADSVEKFQRAMLGTHILVPMSLAKGKLQLLYRLKVLQQDGIWKSQEQAKILGERNGPNIWITAKAGQRLSLQTAEYLAKLSLVTEANLKGHSQADPELIFSNFIAAACVAIKLNTPLPLNIR